jgi:hypothetical protein
MVQTDNPNDFISMNRRAAISRADLLRVWYSAGPDAAKWLAKEMDFHFVAPLQPADVVELTEPEPEFDIPNEPTTKATLPESIPIKTRAFQSLFLSF